MRIDKIPTIASNIKQTITKTKTPPTRGEMRVAQYFNKTVGLDKRQIILPKQALTLINNYTVLNNSQRGDYDNAYFSQLGKYLLQLVLRKTLINEFSNKNTYILTYYEKGIRSYGSKPLREMFNFNEFLNVNDKQINTRKNIFSNDTITNRFHSMFSMIYSTGSIETVEKVLTPIIKRTLRNQDNNNLSLLGMLRNYFSQNQQTFRYEIAKVSDDVFSATSLIDGVETHKTLGKTIEESKNSLFLDLLKSFNLYPQKRVAKINPSIFDIDKIENQVKSILEKTGFLRENNALPQKRKGAYDYVLRAFYPDLMANFATTFQKLEYYGDAVLNMFIERYLIEKKLSLSEKHYMCVHLRANKFLTKLSDKLELQKYIVTNKHVDDKLKADTFEAFIGALHYSYPDKDVYKFTKNLFDEFYEEIEKQILRGHRD